MSINTDTVISFHRAGGTSVTLGPGGPDDRILLLEGSKGLGVAPVSFSTSPVLTGHGSTLRGARMDEGEIFIPILIECESANEYNTLIGSLNSLFSTLNPEPLTIRVKHRGRDEWREKVVYYAGGLESGYGDLYRGKWSTVGLRFKYLEATWRGRTVTESRSVTASTKHFLSDTQDFFPVQLSDGVVDGDISFYVTGDTHTYPSWRIVGPGEDISLTHTTSGKRMFIDGLVYSHDPITIDMEKGTVLSPEFPSFELHNRVSMDSRHFKLNPGDNHLVFSMINATTESKITLSYQPRYLGGI